MPAARTSSPKRGQRRSAKAGPTESRTTKTNIVEQLVNRILKPLDLVVLSRERIQETLDEAAERGRVTRADANELVHELVRRGRQQTDDLLKDFERLVGTATRRARTSEPVDRIVRGADRARRSVGAGSDSSFPIAGYEDLTARQVQQRLADLTPAQLRQARDFERKHANRKSVLDAIERALR